MAGSHISALIPSYASCAARDWPGHQRRPRLVGSRSDWHTARISACGHFRQIGHLTSYYFWAGNEPQFGYSGVTIENIAEARGSITATFSFQNR